MEWKKPICFTLLAVILCVRSPIVFAEELFIEESAPAPEEEIFYEDPVPDETQDSPTDKQLEEEIGLIDAGPVPDETEDSSPDEQLEEEDDLIDSEPELTDTQSFLFQTPEDIAITFGVESQSIGFTSVSEVSDMPEGARIMLYIDDPAFVNVDDPDETIPLSITDAEGNNVICLWDEFTGEQTVELYLRVSAENWARASLGRYAAMIRYSTVVE